jgi:hypothetical protein
MLVNYRDEETLSDEHDPGDGTDASAAVRSLAADALSDPDAERYEVQVGFTRAGRAGNTATHLLEAEGPDSMSILDPRTPTVPRTDLDGAAMSWWRRPSTFAWPCRIVSTGLWWSARRSERRVSSSGQSSGFRPRRRRCTPRAHRTRRLKRLRAAFDGGSSARYLSCLTLLSG